MSLKRKLPHPHHHEKFFRCNGSAVCEWEVEQCPLFLKYLCQDVHNGSLTSLTACHAIPLQDGREAATAFTSHWPHSRRTLHQVQQELLESHWQLLRGRLNSFFENNEVSNREIPVRPSISTRKRTPSQTEKLKTTFFLSAFELKMASKAHGSPLTARKHLRLCRPGRVSVACWGGFHTMSQEPYNGFTVGFW